MSGTPCKIIIQGNRAQGNTRMALSGPMSTGVSLAAQQLIGGFESLCELGTSEYDGSDPMTDAQKQSAVDIMSAYNVAIEPLLVGHGPPSSIAVLVTGALGQVTALLDAVLANT